MGAAYACRIGPLNRTVYSAVQSVTLWHSDVRESPSATGEALAAGWLRLGRLPVPLAKTAMSDRCYFCRGPLLAVSQSVSYLGRRY
ncbi:MAG: hypothetical protein ACI96P_000128, partial [Candidatus Azotimanducaceae bacterium]